MQKHWQNIFNLIKKTGDRMVVIDQNSDNVYVVMDLNNYQQLVFRKNEVSQLTEDELLDRINRDIAVWSASQEPEQEWEESVDFASNDVSLDKVKESELAEEDDEYYLEPVE